MNRRVALIGFSGCGKSHLSRELAAKHGFVHVDCDQRIEAKLGPALPPGSGTRRLAAWLGQPYDLGFSGRQQRYFFAEQEVLQEVVGRIEEDAGAPDTVIDTTGSVVYVERPLLDRLRTIATVVYLKISADDEQSMFEQYLADPKPVIWQTIYKPEDGEPPADALRRCYSLLMAQRAAIYESLSHVVVPISFADRARFSASELLKRTATTHPAT